MTDLPPVPIKIKAKFRAPQGAKKTTYRSRTGPHCCNGNCASSRKKNARAAQKKVVRT